MTAIEEWLKEEKMRDLTGNEKEILEELKEDALFSVYCQTGGGECMSEFGNKVATYAPIVRALNKRTLISFNGVKRYRFRRVREKI